MTTETPISNEPQVPGQAPPAPLYDQARNPRWANAGQSAITLEVDFSFISDEWVPFTASPNDSTAYGPELFARAVAGDFGPVAAYVAPPAPVPASISDRQFAHELREREILTQAEALDFVRTGAIPSPLQVLIDALPTQAERDNAELLLAGATVFERAHPLAAIIGAAFGWTEAQVDDFFRAAAAR